jgi:hypothetical protein
MQFPFFSFVEHTRPNFFASQAPKSQRIDRSRPCRRSRILGGPAAPSPRYLLLKIVCTDHALHQPDPLIDVAFVHYDWSGQNIALWNRTILAIPIEPFATAHSLAARTLGGRR